MALNEGTTAGSRLIRAEEGDTVRARPVSVTRKVGEEDGVGFSIVVFEAAAGFQAPPDRHANTREDWAPHVLSGEVEFVTEAGAWRAGAGDTVVFPRGHAFAWSNPGDVSARCLAVYVRAGFERFFFDLGEAVGAEPDAAGDPGALQRIVRPLWARYGIR